MAIYVNDSGTLRQLRFIAINDSGTVRRVNSVYVNDSGSLEGPFSAIHTTSRSTNTETAYASGTHETAYNTTTAYDTTKTTQTDFNTTPVKYV